MNVPSVFSIYLFIFFYFFFLQNNGEKTPSKGSSTATTPSSDRKTSDGSSPEPPLDLPQVCCTLFVYYFNFYESYQYRPNKLVVQYYLLYSGSRGSLD